MQWYYSIPMKIAVLTSGILPVPAVQGGAVENLIDFYMEYNEKHHLHDITVYSVWHPDVKKHPSLQSKVNHYRYIDTSSLFAKMMRRLYKVFHSLEYYNYFIEFFFEQAYRQIRKEHYDYILIENRPGYVYKLSKRGFTNLILHLHNDLLNSDTPYSQDIYDNLRKVITVSDYVKHRVESITPFIPTSNNKIITVYNGINLHNFHKNSSSTITRKDIGFSNDDYVLVYSGRLNKDKGIVQLVDAMMLLKDLPQVKLMILGGSFFGNVANEDCFVRSLKEKSLPIKERIVFTGFVDYEKMPEYLQLADVAVIPSIWAEPFGLTVVEAQAMGLPTIVSKQGGIPEIVSAESAVIVSTDESYEQHLADAIRKLFQSPQQRANMADAARLNATNFDKERYARNFFHVLESML